MWLSIVFTVFMLGVLLTLPPEIVEKIPSTVIHIVYTGIILILYDRKQGKVIELHRENGNEFYSTWRAVGIGIVNLIIYLTVVFACVFYSYRDEIFQAN